MRIHGAPRRGRPGFTLLELAAVLTILGLLSALSIHSYAAFRKHARTSEAVMNVQVVASLETSRVTGPVACAPSPALVPGARAAAWEASSGFADLGFSPGPETWFQYEVALDPARGARGFVVTARGDLDGDGETSLFELASDAVDVRSERALE